MNGLIEDYLRTRGVRYFRGHHDDEYLFFVDFVAGAYRGRLNVHLEVAADTVVVGISPDRYYPAAQRAGLDAVAGRWNAAAQTVHAVVRDSCDPTLVGVAARAVARPGGPAELAEFAEAAVSGAVELFSRMTAVAPPEQQGPAGLRDAG